MSLKYSLDYNTEALLISRCIWVFMCIWTLTALNCTSLYMPSFNSDLLHILSMIFVENMSGGSYSVICFICVRFKQTNGLSEILNLGGWWAPPCVIHSVVSDWLGRLQLLIVLHLLSLRQDTQTEIEPCNTHKTFYTSFSVYTNPIFNYYSWRALAVFLSQLQSNCLQVVCEEVFLKNNFHGGKKTK